MSPTSSLITTSSLVSGPGPGPAEIVDMPIAIPCTIGKSTVVQDLDDTLVSSFAVEKYAIPIIYCWFTSIVEGLCDHFSVALICQRIVTVPILSVHFEKSKYGWNMRTPLDERMSTIFKAYLAILRARESNKSEDEKKSTEMHGDIMW